MTNEEELAYVKAQIREWRSGTYIASFGAETDALEARVVKLRAEAFEAGRNEWKSERGFWMQKANEYMNEHAKVLREYQVTQSAFLKADSELDACKAKLARVEALATNMEQNWISNPNLDDVVRAVRAALADSGEKP